MNPAISILITDDVAENRTMLIDLLQACLKNAHIQEAEDGETAIQCVIDKIKKTNTSFDLIFMDFKMPGIDGQATTIAIRKIEKQAQLKQPSLIITWSTAKHSPYLEADDWLIKPPHQQNLEQLLSTHGFI